MKFCAYMVICLSLPFALLAEDVDTGEPEDSPADEVEVTPAAQAEGFERYKSILDRMPFGVPPPGFNPDAPNGLPKNNSREETAENAEDEAAEAEANEIEQQILSSITVSMLNRTPDGRIFVGFTDKSVQPPRNYLLMVGEKREGCEWMVADADPDSRQVKISKDGVEATLTLGGGGDSPAGEKAKEGGGTPRNAVARLPHRQGMGAGHRHRRLPPLANPGGPDDDEGEGEKKKLTGLEIARARRQERINRQLAEEEKQRQVTELAQREREERERQREQERKEREQERKEREKERELAAEERKAQMDQLLQLRDELRRQREEKQAGRKADGEEEDTPQNDVQEANGG